MPLSIRHAAWTTRTTDRLAGRCGRGSRV